MGSLSAAELSEYRSTLGSLMYLCTWVRWDLACATSLCAQRTSQATYGDARALNKVVDAALLRSDLGVTIRRNMVDLQSCALIGWTDSAFANAETEKSQYGVCYGLAPKGENPALTGDFSRLTPVAGVSATVKRVVRSTLAAEAYAVSEGVELPPAGPSL